jgi:hypothetical protein
VRNAHEADQFRGYARDKLRQMIADSVVAKHMQVTEGDWHVRARIEVVVLTMDEVYELITTEAHRIYSGAPSLTAMSYMGGKP